MSLFCIVFLKCNVFIIIIPCDTLNLSTSNASRLKIKPLNYVYTAKYPKATASKSSTHDLLFAI